MAWIPGCPDCDKERRAEMQKTMEFLKGVSAMPIIIIEDGDLTASDEATLMAEFEVWKETHPDSQLSFYEWLSQFK